jgi:hypothetical protein
LQHQPAQVAPLSRVHAVRRQPQDAGYGIVFRKRSSIPLLITHGVPRISHFGFLPAQTGIDQQFYLP